MGQRTQIFIHWKVEDQEGFIARYLPWGAHDIGLVSRAAQVVNALRERVDEYPNLMNEERARLIQLCDADFDTRSVYVSSDLLEEMDAEGLEHHENMVLSHDNNNGQLLIDVDGSAIRYAFIYPWADEVTVMDADAYLNSELASLDDADEPLADWSERLLQDEWEDGPATVEYTKKNIDELHDEAELMTQEDLKVFLNRDYSKFLESPVYNKDKPVNVWPHSIIRPVPVTYQDVYDALNANLGEKSRRIATGDIIGLIADAGLRATLLSSLKDDLDNIVCDLIYEGKIWPN